MSYTNRFKNCTKGDILYMRYQDSPYHESVHYSECKFKEMTPEGYIITNCGTFNEDGYLMNGGTTKLIFDTMDRQNYEEKKQLKIKIQQELKDRIIPLDKLRTINEILEKE